MKWTLTDSDTKQYGRYIRDRIFQFKQPDLNENEPVTIYLDRYSFDQIEDCIRSYGYSQLSIIPEHCLGIFKEYHNQADWIMAECLFEMEEFPKS